MRDGGEVNAPRTAVLELHTALHNWRREPSPDNARALVVASETLCGHTLDLCASLERIADTPVVGLEPLQRCACGGLLARIEQQQTKNVPILTCSSCNGVFAFVRLNGGPNA